MGLLSFETEVSFFNVGSILPPHLSLGNFYFLTWGNPYHHIYEQNSATFLIESAHLS